MEPEVSQGPAVRPYREADETTPLPYIIFVYDLF
jgi:hypothetical protein